MVDFTKLPKAPSKEVREEMIESFMDSDDYKDDEICQAIIDNVRDGNMIIVSGNLSSLTQEGYERVRSMIKKTYN